MLKAIATRPDGSKILILGIDKGNVKRMRKGQPILVHGGEVGIGPVEIVIHYRGRSTCWCGAGRVPRFARVADNNGSGGDKRK